MTEHEKLLEEIKVMQKNGITNVLSWKIYYDTITDKACGRDNHYVAVCDQDKQLPAIINRPNHIEVRDAILIVFDKKETESVGLKG